MNHREKCLRGKDDDCALCDSEEDVQVHHVDGDRANNDLDNLLPVCRECHGKIHDGAEGYEEWTEQILPKERRTRQLQLSFSPEDQEDTKVIKEITPADTDQAAIRLALDQYSNRIEAMGERRDLLDDAKNEFGPVDEDTLINGALLHLLESLQNMEEVSGRYPPNTIKDCCDTSVLQKKFEMTSVSVWRD